MSVHKCKAVYQGACFLGSVGNHNLNVPLKSNNIFMYSVNIKVSIILYPFPPHLPPSGIKKNKIVFPL